MAQLNRDPKEVRLFGEKSIKEEAYRQKILQLEKELVRLEGLAKDSHVRPDTGKPHEHLDRLYYESLISFDKKAKKEQEFLEKRAAEITDRLDLQAQRLILTMEASFHRKIRWFIVCLLAAVLLFAVIFLSFSSGFKINTPIFGNATTKQDRNYTRQSTAFGERLSYIKTALQTQTKYHHQYEVVDLSQAGGVYMVEISLNSSPDNKWFLKDICSDAIEVFQKYSSGTPAEFSFLYKGRLYLKAYLTEPSHRQRIQYFY